MDAGARATRSSLLLAALLVGCAARVPEVAIGPLADGLDAFLAAHVPADENIRADRVARTETASYHVVQVHDREAPHRHAAHDLTVFVLRGRGTLVLGHTRIRLRAGDAVLIPRGTAHSFVNEGRGRAVTLAVFTPPLDAPDAVPAGEFD
ncbi:MAG: cupin domain-containing protein [Deltaproteobacteria bacterium]|nr:MAG: cupin domain-containing protein [Deltaproteobacteria bacterium]